MHHSFFLLLLVAFTFQTQAQTVFVQDDFEGGGTISSWFGDDCGMNIAAANPSSSAINSSATVLSYSDVGGLYANVRFDVSPNFDVSTGNIFSLKIYVPSSGVSGSQPNQVSLKLQDGTLGSPWVTQSEIIQPIVLDQWQTVTFDFANDPYINLDGGSLPPTDRSDFNRIVLQVNGEGNNDNVLAYFDDILFDAAVVTPNPVFDQLVWSDEFDVDGSIDATKWFAQTQLPPGGNWYNGEIQHYTNRIENAFVDNGTLKVMAKKETFTDQGFTKQYTSARLNSKYAFTYGRIEVRAKLPSGVGTWPAIWTLGKNIQEPGGYWETQGFGTAGWPVCGEIDIMEHWGDNPNYVSSATHTPSSFGGTVNVGGQVIPTAISAFHVYGLTWTADKLVFDVDGVEHFTYEPEVKDANTWPFDADQYFLLNVAILPFIDPSITSAAMEIDYVRVYQESTCATPTGVQTTVFSPTSATLSWNPVVGATGYQVSGGPVGGGTKTFKTAATSRNIPVLNPSTTYEWQVQTYCDPVFSQFSDLQAFSTPATRQMAKASMVPNPSTGSVRITLPYAGEWTLRVIDMQGRTQQVRQLSGLSQVEILDGLAAGVYVVQLVDANTEWHEQLIVH